MANNLVIFNHKGGVGKTTLTVNIATALAEIGQKVLLVDADPQCNLSSYLLDASVLDDLLDESDFDQGKTLWSAVQAIAEGTGLVKLIKPIELPKDGMFLIPGDIQMSEFENELSDFWTQAAQRKAKGYRGVTSIYTLVKDICEKNDIDVVLFDVGPNIGPLNKTILLGCDSLIIPVACDVFSLRALKTVGRVLVQWIQEWDTIRALAPSSFELMSGKPRLLGYIPQRFRIYRGAPAKSHSQMMGEIDKKIRSDVIKVMSDYDENLVIKTSNSPIGKVKDYGSLMPTAQTAGAAIWDVTSAAALAEVRNTFVNIAKTILKRM